MAARTIGVLALAGQDQYEYVRDLSAGAHGFVQLAHDTHDRNAPVAIKFLSRGKKNVDDYVLRELKNHRLLLHPHIVAFKEVFLTQEHLAIVMEYVEGGNMLHKVVRVGGFTERDSRWYFQQLMLGVDFAHKKGVCFRDIKLENALIDCSCKPLLKLCDFGYSKSGADSLPKSNVGTLGYIAPEVMMGQRRYCGKAADIWSCGCFLYCMTFCRYPFERDEDAGLPEAQRRKNIMSRSMAGAYTVPGMIKDQPTSAELRHLLSRMLQPPPQQRASMQEIWEHSWFREDLPPAADSLNRKVVRLRRHAGWQTEQEVRRVWAEGAQPAAAADDELITEAIDEYEEDEL